MYLSNVLPWQSSSWVAPPPEEIARIRAAAGTHEPTLAEEGDIQAARSRGELEPEQKDSMSDGSEDAVAAREAEQEREKRVERDAQ
jgi:hypothetical protein